MAFAAPTDKAVKGPIVHDGDLTMEADAALTRFALVFVSAAGKVTVTGGTESAIGIVDRAYADGDKDVSVLVLGKGRVLHMVAASAIAVGTVVKPVAAGKVDDAVVGTDTVLPAGIALTAAAADNDVIEVLCL